MRTRSNTFTCASVDTVKLVVRGSHHDIAVACRCCTCVNIEHFVLIENTFYIEHICLFREHNKGENKKQCSMTGSTF